MKRLKFLQIVLFASLCIFSTQISFAANWMGHLVIKDNSVWPNGHMGNYGVVKYLLDESQNETIPVEISVQVYGDGSPHTTLDVEVYTNLNRRDYAKVWESADAAGSANSYFLTYPMTYIGMSGNNYVYKTDLQLSKTGVYRLTTRFRVNNGPWQWHNGFQYDGIDQRDCVFVVSPKKILELTVYEANPLVVEAVPGNSFNHRSTFDDFTDHDTDGFDPFNLSYVKNSLGFNTIWIMPVFPIAKERWDPNSKQWTANYSPGSPYAARDYWSVNEALVEANNQSAGMSEFQYMMDKAEALGLNVFIDVAFNHSGRDTIYGQGAVDLGYVQPAGKSDLIRNARPSWISKGGYDYRHHSGSQAEIAPYAPADRLGEHNWYDAGLDWYFGNYSSLGPKPGFGDTSQGGALDERDLFFTDLDPAGGHDWEVENVWNYFAYILPYWLNRTQNKLDGIRADFAQGLPPRAWEYIINKTRQQKWDFIFLGEALDPDAVRYRVNRHFDLLTTVDHWLYRNSGVTMSQLVSSLESEADLYGYNAVVMHNGTSHDEEGNANVWLMAARYAVASASYGVPMIYMSQPLGVPHKVDFQTSWQNIKHYWDNANNHVFNMYQRINNARQNHAALRSLNRYFLMKRFGGGFNDNIFSVARWAGDDIVLVFVNLRDYVIGSEIYGIPQSVPLDTSPGTQYQAYNLVADTSAAALWPAPRTAADIYQNGVFVKFNYPNETQYIELRKVNP